MKFTLRRTLPGFLLFLSFITCLGSGCERPPAAEEPASGLENHLIELTGPADLDTLVEKAENARLVLLGESTHGTREFYEWRLKISQRLVREADFDFIVFEGDWSPFSRVNRFTGDHSPGSPDTEEFLRETFRRWPPWMWANPVMVELVEWFGEYNRVERKDGKPVGLYGMDIYGHWDSMHSARRYLRESGREKLVAAAGKYDCFARYEGDEWGYARAVFSGAETSAGPVGEVVRLLEEKRNLLEKNGPCRDYFSALQNASVVRKAEEYYRLAPLAGPGAWNSRAGHMAETVERLLDFYGPDSRGIIWAHNTHVGDARATAMARRGEINIGQLARQKHGRENILIVGFGTHRGTVRTGSEWGAPGRAMSVPPGRPGSLEDTMREFSPARFLVHFRGADMPEMLEAVGHRAIGVVYDPALEERNYVPTVPALRYDSFIFIEETSALDPLRG